MVTGNLVKVLNSSFAIVTYFQTETLIFLSVLFTLIVLGNCAVLATLLASKNRKSRMNFFIMHLAIADLLVGLVNVLTDILWKITVEWHAGNAMCKIVRYAQVVVTYSSTYVLVALSIDRYDAITHPMNFSGGCKYAVSVLD
ncbi:cardioacceleratory peptide receptor-like [Tropilaelaps mercedesae]|uniref:Cardioacceleratory peptide receptor-like n=1 Tax=Tropilaelaps mercedesae TaxID=418985 RepID=A0A1V9X7B4_9ACAR|nr:cardioacceleratory peptide receptor-like [Tropilaelaps mercedesae]